MKRVPQGPGTAFLCFVIIPLTLGLTGIGCADLGALSSEGDDDSGTIEPSDIPGISQLCGTSTGSVTDDARVRACEALNVERYAAGLQGLRLDAGVNAAAQAHAQHLSQNPTGNPDDPQMSALVARLGQVGVSYSDMDHFMSRNSSKASSVVNQWRRAGDPGQSFLRPGYQRLGVGLYRRVWVLIVMD